MRQILLSTPTTVSNASAATPTFSDSNAAFQLIVVIALTLPVLAILLQTITGHVLDNSDDGAGRLHWALLLASLVTVMALVAGAAIAGQFLRTQSFPESIGNAIIFTLIGLGGIAVLVLLLITTLGSRLGGESSPPSGNYFYRAISPIIERIDWLQELRTANRYLKLRQRTEELRQERYQGQDEETQMTDSSEDEGG